MNYVIAVQDPERSLDNAAESAIRHEVGSNFMDQILTTGREQMAAAVQDRLQEYMDNYDTGIRVARVNVVQASHLMRCALPLMTSYVRGKMSSAPRIRPSSMQISVFLRRGVRLSARLNRPTPTSNRLSRKQRVKPHALINCLLSIEKAPEVTRQRLYIESLQDVMTASSKIMIDVEGGNNMLYVPLDKIMEQNAAAGRLGGTTQDLRDLANQLARISPAFNCQLS